MHPQAPYAQPVVGDESRVNEATEDDPTLRVRNGMTMASRRKFLEFGLSGIFGLAAVPLWAEAPDRSPRPQPRPGAAAAPVDPTDEWIKAAKLGGPSSFIVIDAATGSVLAARDADNPLPPASVAKAVTALYAINKLGPEFRFRTRVLATGPIEGGILQGDLILVGDGDPTLQTDALGDLAASVAKSGLKGITGRFLIWDGALPSLSRIAEDQPVHVGYNAALGGLNLNFNRVHFEWKRQSDGWRVSMDARGERFVPQVRMARMRISEREAPLFTYAVQGSAEDWTVASSALGKGGSRWLPVRHPTTYLAEVFQTLTKAQGISLPEPERLSSRPVGDEIAALDSEALTDILRDMLKYSTNITAECVGLRASGASDLASSAKSMTDWVQSRYGVVLSLVDHSGLGAVSRATANDLARLLVAARAKGDGLTPLLRDVGLQDDKGKTIKGHPVKVMAKSGTLNFVSGLAGHILPPNGRELVFAIFSADLARRDALTEAERESPPGGKEWTRRARHLQAQLISRWAASLT